MYEPSEECEHEWKRVEDYQGKSWTECRICAIRKCQIKPETEKIGITLAVNPSDYQKRAKKIAEYLKKNEFIGGYVQMQLEENMDFAVFLEGLDKGEL